MVWRPTGFAGIVAAVMNDIERAVQLRVGRNIRKLRERRKLSLEEFGAKINRSDRYVGQVERGEANPSLRVLTAIATELSIDVAVLLIPTPDDHRGPRSHIVAHKDVERLVDSVREMLRLLERIRQSE